VKRVEEPGSVSIRAQVGIRAEDPRVFRPIRLTEALRVARIIAADDSIPEEIRGLVEVGIPLDLMPGHVTPAKTALAEALRVSVRTIRRRELAWELCDQRVRFDLVHRASRLVFAERGSKT
jgi:hypothetical protein